MKSCLILPNTSPSPTEHHSCYCLYPTLLSLLMMSGFSHAYIVPNSARKQAAFFDFTDCKPKLDILPLLLYRFSCTGRLVFPAESTPPKNVHLNDTQTILHHVSHVLTINFSQPLPNPILSAQTTQQSYMLPIQQFHNDPFETTFHLLRWMET